MSLPEIVLTEYAQEDKEILELWWKNADVLHFVHDLEKQEQGSMLGSKVAERRYIARPMMRLMVRDRRTDIPVGYVSVQVSGESWSRREEDPVLPPFHGGVNIVVDPERQCGGIGAATLEALLRLPQLADVVTLSGSVDATNTASRGCCGNSASRRTDPP